MGRKIRCLDLATIAELPLIVGDRLDFLNEILRQTLGSQSAIVPSESVAGGCINRVLKLNLKNGKPLLVKLAEAGGPGFRTEAQGLAALAETNSIATPQVIAVGDWPQRYLILEWIEAALPQAVFWRRLGQQLAALHDADPADQKFGFTEDNIIGATPQINQWGESWASFFCDRRLRYQFELACGVGYFSKGEVIRFEKFLEKVSAMLEQVSARPSLIHGDLWSGNFLCDENQQPVLIDPAVSYSHSEAELSIMRMFGGFERQCFEAYHEIRPAQPGANRRIEIYSLYHYLNHLNLFGRSYLNDCWRIINKYV